MKRVAFTLSFVVWLAQEGAHAEAPAQSSARRPPGSVASPAPRHELENPLELEDVLDSLERHHPLVMAERENVRVARAELLSARGGFDPVLSLEGRAAPVGYYDTRRFGAQIEQATPVLGASLYAGYRLTRGKVPDYYGEYETLDRGELKAGVRVPLWADRSIDARRAGVAQARASEKARESDYQETLLELQRAAAEAYFEWVAAGLRLAILREQVALAQLRDAQIGSKVALGALPPIEQLDNRRSLLEREQKLVSAGRSFEKATFYLSLFLRDTGGRPVLPGEARLPLELAQPAEVSTSRPDAERRALSERPALASYEQQLQRARVERDLADNQVAPRLDAQVEVSRDMGDFPDAERAATLRPTVVEGGVRFSMPLLLRSARGKFQAAHAKLRALEQKASYARDKVRAEVQDSFSQLEAARERVEFARKAAEAAEQVAQGERERFELGATTVLFVNLREQTAADAEISLVDALAEANFALVRCMTVMGVRSGS